MNNVYARILSILASFLLLSAIVQAQTGITTNVQQDVWLRVGAGPEWRGIRVINAGEPVTIDGRISDNTWVRGITANGEIGWMFASPLAVDPNAISTLPVLPREAPITVPPPAANNVSPVPAAPPPPVSAGNIITATAIVDSNIRIGPGTNFRIVGGLKNNQSLNIDGRDASSVWVRGMNAQGTIGWVFASLLNLSASQIAALPAIDPSTPFAGSPPTGSSTQIAEAPPDPVNIAPIAGNTPVGGFAYGGHVPDLSLGVENALRSAGMTWIKTQFRYSQGMDPSAAAGIINDARGRGFRILLGVVGSPGQINNANYFNDYANFVGGVAALGADAIEIWNEQNIDREWPAGQIDPALYTQLLAQSFNAIKSNNPNTWVVSGGLAPTGFFGGCGPNGCDDAPYLAGMAAAGAAQFMDCVGIHYNEGILPPDRTSGDPRNPSNHYTRYYGTMVNTYYNAFNRSRPLCFTELGYLTPEGFGGLPPDFAWAGNVTVAQQAAWLDQVMSIARGSGIVRLIIVWNVGFTNFGADPMAGYSIIRPDGSCPACVALGN